MDQQPAETLARLQQLVQDLLREAQRQGATAAEASATFSTGLEINVRLGELETLEHTRDNTLSIQVYFGQRKGSASTTDLSAAAVRDTVAAACSIATHTQEEPCSGLPDAAHLAEEIPDLDLDHPWDLTVEQGIELARICESAARTLDKRIVNSEGANLSTQRNLHVYGNTLGFLGGYPSTRHSLSCALVAREGDSMERDYWWTTSRAPEDLESPEQVGRRAAERTLARLHSRRVPTGPAPVLFSAPMAAGLLRNLVAALSGANLYRKASFLLDQLGTQRFPDFVRIHEEPHLPRALGSAPFDGEGVATRAKDLVREGVLRTYLLDSYTACRLGLVTTGNAGGVHNLRIQPNAGDRASLLREMDRGLLVTELLGQGVNLVTGDYSRGAAGFWVEGGAIQYPVSEITIAGNLKEMFRQLVAVGDDCDFPGNVQTGSWLIERMMIAGA